MFDPNKFLHFVLNLKKLTNLNLRNNCLSSIPPSIDILQNLRELNLSNNELSALPHTIRDLKNLTHLNISGNNFAKIPEYLKNLKTIDISNNPFISLESFKYLFSNPNLTITSRLGPMDEKYYSINSLKIPKKVKDYWYDGNYEKIIHYYTPSISEIAQKYAQAPKSLTNREIERLKDEATIEERNILELSLPKNDPILKIINEKLKINLKNGFELMR